MPGSDLDRKKKSPQCGGNHTEGRNFPGTNFGAFSNTSKVNRLSLQAGGLCRSLLQALAEVAMFALLAIIVTAGRSM
jgi:hypothetical protein